MTDREGRIVIPPGFADGLLILRLLAGNVEPMVEFPIVLGEFTGERTIPIVPRPQTVALETQLDSLRDEILDLVAVRARLEARIKARFDGEDWAGVEATIKEFNQLPARDSFATKVDRLKEEAAFQQAKTKSAVLTKTAQAQLAEVSSLIDRYLDRRPGQDLHRGAGTSPRRHHPEGRGRGQEEGRPADSACQAARPGSCPGHQEGRRRNALLIEGGSDRARARLRRLRTGRAREAEELGELRPAAEQPLEGGVERRSIWLYQVVTIRVNSSIFSSCSRV